MEKLKLAAGMTGEQKRYAVEAALLLGFQTETATFPVITGTVRFRCRRIWKS